MVRSFFVGALSKAIAQIITFPFERTRVNSNSYRSQVQLRLHCQSCISCTATRD